MELVAGLVIIFVWIAPIYREEWAQSIYKDKIQQTNYQNFEVYLAITTSFSRPSLIAFWTLFSPPPPPPPPRSRRSRRQIDLRIMDIFNMPPTAAAGTAAAAARPPQAQQPHTAVPWRLHRVLQKLFPLVPRMKCSATMCVL